MVIAVIQRNRVVNLERSDKTGMEICYLLLGSNAGDRLKYLRKAAEAIELIAGQVVQRSSIYETDAWGFVDNTAFLNQVIVVNTSLRADELMKKMLLAETELGRERARSGEGYSARTIDIDLLFYGNHIINEPGLVVPHPRLHLRRFTLIPMAEIAPGFVHPVFNMSIARLESSCTDQLKAVKYTNVS
jgi:2-amino-4-hydroxy-6-hydroxymethyldihydropteridine diphosphokinase